MSDVKHCRNHLLLSIWSSICVCSKRMFVCVSVCQCSVRSVGLAKFNWIWGPFVALSSLPLSRIKISIRFFFKRKHLLILCCASNQLLNVIRMFPHCNMFIHATLNITFYCRALQQNIFCRFWLIWNQHLNPFHSYPSLQNSTQSWVSWGSSESPAETVKPLLLQTNMAHSSCCSLSF